jgi:hypothetical protein
MLNTNDRSSLIDMSKDIIVHPDSDLDYISDIFESEVFSEAEIEDINSALRVILGQEDLSDTHKKEYMENLWKVNYYEKPPSIHEFLSEKWIGLASESIYPHVGDILKNYFDPLSQYRHLLLAISIGGGKTTLACLAVLYEAVLFNLLRSPKQYLKLAEFAPIVITMLSFTLEKAHDIMVKPSLNILSGSPRFERCRDEAHLLKKQREYGKLQGRKFVYTTAGEGSVFRIGDILFKSLADKSAILGLNILMSIVSEINFFVERGCTQEYVNDFYWDIRGRIQSRLGRNNFFARTILDSSVSSFENKLEKYMWYESHKDPTNYFVHKRKWDIQPTLFEEWNRDNTKVFPVFLGDVSKAPRIISPEEVSMFDHTQLEWFPIDLKSNAEQSLVKTIKDYASIPTGMDAKLITNYDTIESIFTPTLKNFYTYKHAPSSLPPETLLWDMIKRELFVYSGQGQKYEFYRYPKVDRFLSFDLAKKHDMAACTLTHLERNLKGEKVYVIDFSLAVMSTKEEINIDAFKWLALALVRYGNIKLKKVSFDGFQSDSSRQFLLRYDIDAIRQSVDMSMEPYMSFISYMNQGRVFMGRNLVMKNNLKSLILQRSSAGKQKVEHEQGEWIDLMKEDWDTSKMGYYGKDLSDATVASIALADLYGTESADIIWDEKQEIEKHKEKDIDIFKKELLSKLNLVPKANAWSTG